MSRRDVFLFVLLLVALVVGVVGCCLWLIAHIGPLCGLLLLFFLIASG